MSEPSRAQTWTAEGYERNARFVSDLGAAVLDLLAPSRANAFSILAVATAP